MLTSLMLAAVTTIAPPAASHASFDLLLPTRTVSPGQTGMLGIHVTIESAWHLYWNGQNDSGIAPTIDLSGSSPHLEFGTPRWPAPVRHVAEGDIVDHIYEREFMLLVPFTVSNDATPGSKLTWLLKTDYLVCSSVCLPGKAEARLESQVASAPSTASPDATRIDDAGRALPTRLQGTDTIDQARVPFIASRRGEALELKARAEAELTALAFFPGASGLQASNLAAECGRPPPPAEATSPPSLSIRLVPGAPADPRLINGLVECTNHTGIRTYFEITLTGTMPPSERLSKESSPSPSPSPSRRSSDH